MYALRLAYRLRSPPLMHVLSSPGHDGCKPMLDQELTVVSTIPMYGLDFPYGEVYAPKVVSHKVALIQLY
jgi:hypothetical protein